LYQLALHETPCNAMQRKYNLAKVEVASSNLVSRSKRLKGPTLWGLFALTARDTGSRSNVYDLFLRLVRSLRRNFALLFDLQLMAAIGAATNSPMIRTTTPKFVSASQ
jgi:hypothetical protein